MARCRVSQSKVKNRRHCSQAFWFKYVENLIRNKVKRPFQFGRMVHEMLEADANKKDPFKLLKKMGHDNKKLFAAEREMYGEIVEDVGDIMTEYFEHWKGDPLRFIKRGGKNAEHAFELDIGDQITVTGKIDSLVRTRNKLKWISDHKTFKQAWNDDHRWRDIQSCIYIRVADTLGMLTADGMLWNYIKSKAPTRPMMLKAGTLSTKNIDSLPSVVLKTIKQHGLKAKDYPDLIDNAEHNRSTYFMRDYTPRNDEVIDSIWNDFLSTAQDIADNPKPTPVKNIGRHCDWCDFEPLCRAELTGGDVDFLKEREYHVSEEGPEDSTGGGRKKKEARKKGKRRSSVI